MSVLSMSEIPPKLLERLRKAQGGRPVEVHLVLHEDDYETKYGDGRFLYLDSVFFDAAAAKARRERLEKENRETLEKKKTTVGYTYHQKTTRIILDEHLKRILTESAYPPQDIIRLLAAP
jgi:hypothetical protein